MKNRIIICLISCLLVSSSATAEQTTNVNTLVKKNKFIEFFSVKSNKKSSLTSETSDNVINSDVDTVFTQEKPKGNLSAKGNDGFWSKFKKKERDKDQKSIKNVDDADKSLVNQTKNEEVNKSVKNKTKPQFVTTPSGEEIQINANKTVSGSISNNSVMYVDDCVRLALENHPAIRVSFNSAEIYRNKVAQAWANYFPTFGLDANYSKNDMLISNFNVPNQKYGMYNAPSLTARMLLFDFGKTKAVADMSKKTYLAAKDNLQMSVNEVIYNVKASYYKLLYALQQEKVYAETVKAYELHVQQARAYYKIGTKAKIDVTTAEYNLSKAKLDYIKAKNNVILAYAQVSSAMGLPAFEDYKIADKLESRSYNVKFEDILSTANSTRPELLAAKKKAEGSELLVKSSLRAFAPNVVAFGSYNLGGKTPAFDHGYQLGAGLTYSTTNLYLLKKQVDESRATYQRDLADYENTKQNVYLEVKSAYIELYNAQDSVPVAKASMNEAKEQYKLASGRYKVGLGDAIELKDAETTHRNAQLEYYNTLLNYNIAAANIERVIGSPVTPTGRSLL